ncbi:MAG: hypothetical protein N3B13_09935, partial [Deltaproteobacteria bacterium]|nr:hypothetical protein [Deltaproteobacteria bacterium]
MKIDLRKALFVFSVFLLLLFSVEASAKNPLSEGFLFLEKGDYKRAFSNFSSIKKKEPYVYT